MKGERQNFKLESGNVLIQGSPVWWAANTGKHPQGIYFLSRRVIQ